MIGTKKTHRYKAAFAKSFWPNVLDQCFVSYFAGWSHLVAQADESIKDMFKYKTSSMNLICLSIQF